MNARMTLLLAATGCLSFQAAQAQHWGYSGATGPEHWSELEADYATCGLGRNQSPIDLTGFVEADLKPLTFSYKAWATDIVYNGHSVQISYAPGSVLTIDGHAFELMQFEGHIVHEDQSGNLAVVAVLYQEGAANPLLSRLWNAVRSTEGHKAGLPAGTEVMDLLPSDRNNYRHNGSLTTPPCSESACRRIEFTWAG